MELVFGAFPVHGCQLELPHIVAWPCHPGLLALPLRTGGAYSGRFGRQRLPELLVLVQNVLVVGQGIGLNLQLA